jgi:hypothetical protein
MPHESLETDYLILGTGAMGMAFADEILTQRPNDRLILVDQHAKAGGHWNDAYSFVSLHQPAAFYGVNSEKLGPGGAALASGVEVLAYYERVLHKFLATGRVQHFSMCRSDGQRRFTSLVEPGLEYDVTVRKKIVDATYMNVEVPSIRAPRYAVAPEISLVPPNDLPGVREPRSGYVIIGAGKTGMDAALFLLARGVDPDHITWIMSNDAWLLDRDQIQPGRVADDGIGAQFEHFASSNSLTELLSSLEAGGRLLRLDKEVWPEKYRCATVDLAELAQLRRISNIVRLGRVVRIDADAIVLEQGSVPTNASRLHVDCSADGLAKREIRPVFEGERITLQSLFMCQQVFSAAVIGYVEAQIEGDTQKNQLCQVVPHPEFSRDFLRAMDVSLKNMEAWTRKFARWLRRSRLSMMHHESLFKLLRSAVQARKIMPEANRKLALLLSQEFPDGVT